MNIYVKALVKTLAVSTLIPVGVGLLLLVMWLPILWAVAVLFCVGVAMIFVSILQDLRRRERNQ